MACSQHNSILLREPVKKEDVHDVVIKSFDQRRPKICEIGASLDNIKKFAMAEGSAVNVFPRRHGKNQELKLTFSRHIEQISTSGLAYLTDNLSVSANLTTESQPDKVLFDACLLVDGTPPTVLSVVRKDHVDNQNVVLYNLTLARGVVQAVRSFTREQFSVVYGVITDEQLKSQDTFQDALVNIKQKTSTLCVPGSLKLKEAKRQHIIQALLSSIALTTSVDDKDNSLWFLTLEQFVILTENIDQREVNVRTAPSSGGKVLMREVATRLERSGPTLLVMESEEPIRVARDKKTCSFMMTVNEWRSRLAKKENLEGLTNMVTNCQDCPPPPGITGRSWTFVADIQVHGSHVEHVEVAQKDLKNTVTNITDCTQTNRKQGPTQENPLETIDKLKYELKTKEMRYTELEKENKKFKQLRKYRMLDKVSLGGWSMDTDYGSDTSSLASLRRLSVSRVEIRTDPKGATGEQGGVMKLLKRMKKTLTFGRSKTDPLLPIYVTAEGPLYVLTDRKSRKPVSLLCQQQEMDRERANIEWCHVTEDGRLVNTKPTSRTQQGRRRFKMYWDTCSTSPIHLPPSPSSLTPVPPAPQYWETETAVGVKEGMYRRRTFKDIGVVEKVRLFWPTVMEMGVVEENMMDSDVMLYDSPRSWCVTVGRCGTHEGYCTQVWNQEKRVKCVTDTMSLTPGTSYTLRYGVVVDIVRGRVGFVDVDKGVVLEKMDVEFTQTIYPVFGVCPYPDHFTVEIKLISGTDVTMTEDKQKLIYKCLK